MGVRLPHMRRRAGAGGDADAVRSTGAWRGWDAPTAADGGGRSGARSGGAASHDRTGAVRPGAQDGSANAGERARTGTDAADAPGANAGGNRLRLFLRASVFDFALVLVIATALTFTVSYGFNSAPDLRGNVALIAGVTAVLLAALFAGSWSKRALAPAAMAYVAAAAIVLGVLAATEPTGTAFFANGQVNDVADNYPLFGLVLVVVPLLCYLLSRRTWGMAVLFLLAVLASAVIQFFYRDWVTAQPGIAAAFVLYAACGASFVYQRYRNSVYRARRVGRTAFGGAFAFSLASAIVCLGVAAAVFFGIIAGLGLTTPEFKPFQDYYQRPVVEYTGTYQRQQVDSPNLKTNQTNDRENDTRKNGEGGSKQDRQKQNGANSSQKQNQAQSQNSFDSNNWNQQFQNIGYDLTDWTSLTVLAIIAAAIVAAVLLRRSQRKRRLRKIADRPVTDQVVWIYDFLLTRFARLGVEKPASLTPMEFALASAHQLEPYADAATQTDFLQVTLGYLRAAYGNQAATDEDLARAKRYYRTFYQRVSRQVGRVRWLWKFWRI